VDSSNELLAVTARPQGNAVEIFTGGPNGGSTPVRVISGPRTGLGSCGPVCNLVIAFSPLTGRIYVAVSDGADTHISVFAGNAAGDARPLSTIAGPATGLAGASVTGIAVSQCDATVYAMIHTSSSGFGRASIDAYRRSARGNIRPLRSFTDSQSRFRSAQGLTVTACPSG
jgi:DNA-binding beta-propeller fold protein YncE